MSTAYTIGYSVLVAALAVTAAWHVVLLSRRERSLWRAAIGRPGLLLQLNVALLLADIVQLASGGRDSVGAGPGLVVAAAMFVYSGGVWLKARRRAS